MIKRALQTITAMLLVMLPGLTFGSEADLKIPELSASQNNILLFGFLICFLGLLFGLYQFVKVKKLKAHQSMLDVSKVIFETCKTYLIQQGKFLILLFVFIALCIGFYFGFLQHTNPGGVLLIISWTVVGIMGSYGVA